MAGLRELASDDRKRKRSKNQILMNQVSKRK